MPVLTLTWKMSKIYLQWLLSAVLNRNVENVGFLKNSIHLVGHVLREIETGRRWSQKPLMSGSLRFLVSFEVDS